MAMRFRRFLSKQKGSFSVAIALRHGRVNFAVLKNSKKGIAPQLIVNDEVAVERQDYAQAVEALLARYAKLNLKYAPTQLVLGPRLVQQTSLDKPALSEEELAQALPWMLKDLIDIPAADMVADFYEPPVQLAGREKIHVVAVKRSWLSEILQPVHAAKLDIQGIVNEDIAMCALFAESEPPAMVVSQYGQQQAQLVLIKQRGLVVSRQLKPIQSIQAQAVPDPHESEELAIELQRSLDYFSGQLRQAPLQHIYLALPGSHLSEFREQLEQSLSIVVERLQYPNWALELSAGDYSDLGVLAGLAYLTSEIEPPMDAEVSSSPGTRAAEGEQL